MPKRIDAEDTVDVATHFLMKLQSEGWGVADIEHHVEYGTVKSGSKRLPVGATVLVRLVPSRS